MALPQETGSEKVGPAEQHENPRDRIVERRQDHAGADVVFGGVDRLRGGVDLVEGQSSNPHWPEPAVNQRFVIHGGPVAAGAHRTNAASRR